MFSALPDTEDLVEAAHAVEDNMIAILAIADLAIAELASEDPKRDDLLEIRKAAALAILKAEKLVARAASVPMLRAS